MVAITDRYRRLVEKRSRNRRSMLLPMRVSAVEGQTLFEGATLDVSVGGVYFRMPGGEHLSVGDRLAVEMSVPAELSGEVFSMRTLRSATIVRVERDSLACRVGCRPRDCGVALAFDPEVPAAALRQDRPVAAVA